MTDPKTAKRLLHRYRKYLEHSKQLTLEEGTGFFPILDTGEHTTGLKHTIRIPGRTPTRFDHIIHPNDLIPAVRRELKSTLLRTSLRKSLRSIGQFALTSAGIFVALMLLFNWSAYYTMIDFQLQQLINGAPSKDFAALATPQEDAPHVEEFLKEPTGMFGTTTRSTHTSTISQQYETFLSSFQPVPPDNRILIPKIGQNIPIQSVSPKYLLEENWSKLEDEIQTALKDGVVHYPGTAEPGMMGNVFITGHSSYYLWDPGRYKDVFALLHNVEIGDTVTIFYQQKRFDYVIEEKKVVSPKDVDVLSQTSDKRLTLMTCTPIGTALNRLILVAKQVP